MRYTAKVICDVNEWQEVLVGYNDSPARFILIRIEQSWPDCVLTPASKKCLRRGASFELFQQLHTGCNHRLFSPAPVQLVFSVSDKPIAWVWRLRIYSFIWLYLSTSDNINFIRNLVVSQGDCVKLRVSQDTDLIMFFSLRLKLWIISFPPAPSKPHTTAPAWMPMATGAAMIVDRSPMPETAKPTLVRTSAVSIPSNILTPRLYFLYTEALKFHSFSRRNLTLAICCRQWPSALSSGR